MPEKMKDSMDRYLKNTCTEQERLLVEAFLQSYQNEEANERPIILTADVKENIWRKINYEAINSSRKKRLRVYLAAAMLALCIVGLWFFTSMKAMVVREAKYGEQISITLPDQSTVLLSGGSSITYPKTFGKIREVRFVGEAFFTVQHDAMRPFIVKAGEVTTTVRGTSFTINTFRDNETHVMVVTGKVEVAAKGNERLILTPGQMAKVDKKSGGIVNRKVAVDVEMQWTQHALNFDGISMREAADIIERRYDVEINFEEESLEKRLIKSDYKYQPLQNILESLCFIQGMKYQKDGKKITFTKEEKINTQ